MKPLVIIVGMHRSGTSFLARSLNLAGVYLGGLESLISHEWEYLFDNLRGHWENKTILNLAEKTLKNNQGSWDDIPANIEIDENLGQEIRNYLNELSNEPSLAYGFKDPRIILCFESWKKYLPENFVIVGIFRDPLKVAESLKKRNGFDYKKSINLWKSYNIQLLQLLEKYGGFLINFDHPKEKIFSELKIIFNALNLLEPTNISDWYSEELLHSDKSFTSDFHLDEETKKIYSDLIKRTEKNETFIFKKTKYTEKNLRAIISSLNFYLYDQSKLARIQINKIKDNLNEKNNKILQIEKEFDERTKWAQSLDSEINQLHNTISTKDSEINQLHNTISTKDSEINQLHNTISTKDSEINQLHNTISTKDSEINQLHNTISTKDSEINQLHNTISTKDSQLDDFQSKYFETKNELHQIQNSILFGMAKRLTNLIDKFFPSSTKRGESMRLVKMALLTYKNEGYQGLTLATKQKFSSKKPIKLTNHTAKHTIDFNETEFDNGVFVPTKQKISTDSSLRQFLTYNYGSVVNLLSYPKISIVILTYNQALLLKKNIKSIRSKTTYSNYEIIVVTNNLDSNSDMRKLLKTLDCKSYVYENEYSFSEMNNFGASKATGEFLIFLNDDVEIVSSNWIESFLKLAENESVGAIGGKLLFSDGRLQEAGCIFWKNGNAWNFGRGQNPESPEFNYVRNVDYCSGSCLFVRKKIFDKIGGFDTSYHPAYVEDAELCFSIRKEGYQILYQPLSEVIHHEGMTQGTNTSQGIKSYQINNLQKFSKKWNHVLKTYREDSIENSFFERNRKDGLNILYVDHYVPEPDKDAGSLRTFRILGLLSYLGHKVTFWPDNLNKSQPYTSELQQKGIEVIFGQNNFGKFLDDRKDLYDIAIISRPHIAPKYIDLIRDKMSRCIILFDTVDLHFLRMARQSKLDDTVSKLELEEIKNMEISLMKKSDLTILTSMEEAKLLHMDYPHFRYILLPTIHIFEGKISDFDSRENMMFIGNFQHPPNVDAASYLLEEIFPKIQNKLPNIQLYVIGPNPPDSIKKHQSDSIHILGYVKNIDEYFNKCRVMLSPLRFGAGVKGKITQSITRGLPTITTSIGVEGIGLTDNENCMIADDANSFAEKVIKIYNDPFLWQKISTNGLKIAQFYSAENMQNTITSLFSKLILK
jgi:GT2 family glycosyltransferase/predicted  nucleic acid-binding Zn-ribbon protein